LIIWLSSRFSPITCLGGGEFLNLMSVDSSPNAYQVLLHQFVRMIYFKVYAERKLIVTPWKTNWRISWGTPILFLEFKSASRQKLPHPYPGI
jgi:hypothetical protein